MVDVSAEIARLLELDQLEGSAVEAIPTVAGWSGERRNPSTSWATTWNRDGARAWVQGDGPVDVEFTLWFHEVQDDAPDMDAHLGGFYAAGAAKLPEVTEQLRCGVPWDRPEEADEHVADVSSFIEYRAWKVPGKELLVGVKQDDTDTPVQLVVVVRPPATEDESCDDWL
ncbi:hypothetical protein [Streptomyces sp. NPDC093808]|uniref:hypothetical protein n=1 Tax=Streptomyces sp. NPDC093808 TaxID=3154985 RepID=UPI0034508766